MVGTLSNIHRGILLIVVTALAISLQDLVFKLFSGDLTLLQIFALRGRDRPAFAGGDRRHAGRMV